MDIISDLKQRLLKSQFEACLNMLDNNLDLIEDESDRLDFSKNVFYVRAYYEFNNKNRPSNQDYDSNYINKTIDKIYNLITSFSTQIEREPDSESLTGEDDNSYLDLKGYKYFLNVLSLTEPGSEFIFIDDEEIKKQKIGYTLYCKIDITKKAVYYLYLYSGILQNNTLEHLQRKHPNIFKDKKLVIFVLRDKTQSHPELKIKNISNKFKPINIYYIEDYIWEKCTPKAFTQVDEGENFLSINNFVFPNIRGDNEELISLVYFKQWFYKESDQVLVFKGAGGIGKTTLAQNVSDLYLKEIKPSKVLFIESREIIAELARLSMQYDELNIYNMYEAFCTHNQHSVIKLNYEQFKVNLDSGNILVVIDGIDEIASKLPKFNVEIFINSIFEFANQIAGGKVIITCRSYFWDTNYKKFSSNIKCIEILPFDLGRAEDFYRISFQGYPKKIEKSLRIAKDFSLKNENSYEFQPFVLDLIKNVVESNGDIKKSNINFDSKILKSSRDNDLIIYHICFREEKRLGQINVDEQILFFLKLSLERNGIASAEDIKLLFIDIFNYEIDDINLEGLKAHPFILNTGSYYSLKYDYFIDYFKSIYLEEFLKISSQYSSITPELIKILSEDCWYNSPLAKEVKNRINVWTEEELLKTGDLISQIIRSNTINEKTRRRAISGLFFIALSINQNNGYNSIESNTKLLIDLFGKTTGQHYDISNLCIINVFSMEKEDLLRFDFSNMRLYDCYIDSFAGFWDCKFNKDTFFYDCILLNLKMGDENLLPINKENFYNCTIDDVFREKIKRHDDVERSIKEDMGIFIESFFNLFFSKGRLERQSVDLIKRRFNGIQQKYFKFEDLIDWLKKKKIIMEIIEFDEEKYKISDFYKADIVKFRNEGLVSMRIEDLIDSLVNEII